MYGDSVALRVMDCRAGAGGNCDWADRYCETAGYGFAFRHDRAGAGGNYDWTDETEEAG